MTDARALGKRCGYRQVIILCVDDGDAVTASAWGRNDELDGQIAVIGDEVFDIVWRRLSGVGDE